MSSPSRSAFILAAAAVAGARPARAQAPSTVRVGALFTDANLGPYYAQELGLFAKAGLSVELVPLTSGGAGLTGLTARSIDVGSSTAIQMASAFLNGVQFQYFAAAAVVDASDAGIAGLCVAKDSSIKTARDFEGKTVSVFSLRDGSQLAIEAYLARNGIDLAKVTFVELPLPAQGGAFERGTISGAFCAEPFLSAPTVNYRMLANYVDLMGDRFLATAWLSTPAWLKENTATARKFADVMYETARWANNKANLERRNEMIVKQTKMEPAAVQRMAHATFATRLDPALIQKTLDIAYKLKYLSQPVRAEQLIFRL